MRARPQERVNLIESPRGGTGEEISSPATGSHIRDGLAAAEAGGPREPPANGDKVEAFPAAAVRGEREGGDGSDLGAFLAAVVEEFILREERLRKKSGVKARAPPLVIILRPPRRGNNCISFCSFFSVY